MGDIALNDAKGTIAEKIRDGADLIMIPLSAVDTDANIQDAYAGGSFLDDVLGDAANTERTTGGWSRKVVLNAALTVTVDDTANTVRVEVPDQVYTSVTAGNDVVAMLIVEDAATDALRQVLTKHDFAVTTDGNDITADFTPATGFWNST